MGNTALTPRPKNWMEQDVNGTYRHVSNSDQHPVCKVQIAESAGSGQFGIDGSGKINAQYRLQDGSNPHSPRNRAAAAELERKLFKAACHDPQFDHKPRETLRQRFLQFNTTGTLGPISPPSASVRNNQNYQFNLANTGRTV